MARFSLTEIQKLKGRDIFFDANVLIYIFGGIQSRKNKVGAYSHIFKKLKKDKHSIATNFLILSEFVNAIFRKEASQKGVSKSTFKKFRSSKDGKEVQESIFFNVNKILNNFKVIDKPLNSKEIKSLLEEDNLDFNDKATEHLCRDKNLVLLTDDGDFANSDIDIISGNTKFFI